MQISFTEWHFSHRTVTDGLRTNTGKNHQILNIFYCKLNQKVLAVWDLEKKQWTIKGDLKIQYQGLYLYLLFIVWQSRLWRDSVKAADRWWTPLRLENTSEVSTFCRFIAICRSRVGAAETPLRWTMWSWFTQNNCSYLLINSPKIGNLSNSLLTTWW